MSNMTPIVSGDASRTLVCGAPEGLDALAIADFCRLHGRGSQPIMVIVRDDRRLSAIEEGLAFFAPDLEVLRFPSWDCLPYDRVSPRSDIVAERIATLSRLARNDAVETSPIVVTTANAALQRVLPRDMVAASGMRAAPGNRIDFEALLQFLAENGFNRTGTVVDPGDYAVRGGIVDLFAPGAKAPVRFDLFGDTLESIRSFDPVSQRTTAQLKSYELLPASEIILTEESIKRFRSGYVSTFGGVTSSDPFYEAISAGHRYHGMEHWLPLFHEKLDTLFAYADPAAVVCDHLVEDAVTSRLEQVREYYDARLEALEHDGLGAPPYKPLDPELLYLNAQEWTSAITGVKCATVTPFEQPEGAPDTNIVSLGGRQGRSFAAERQAGENVFDALKSHLASEQQNGKRAVLACWSDGSRDRLTSVLEDHGINRSALVANWSDATALPRDTVALAILGLETGFESADLVFVGEQDILGDRLVRRGRKTKRAQDFLTEVSSLSKGDLVVHVDHGIGRFEGLQTITVQEAPHDCLFLVYAGGDRLFIPVENIDLLTRYGSDDAGAQLDKLGGSGWQARKAKLKQRIRDMAERLIKTAAARELRQGEVLQPADGLYDEFVARFPFDETEDQDSAIDAVLEDLASGRPMDRLICGDVGFGKTEVALRSAFVAVMAGKQVALVVPTTLLARQHFATFKERFAGLPIRIEQASRLVPKADLDKTKSALATGDVDIVVGTHALLGKSIEFRDLGLLIIDEEQHFGVVHKERLKNLRSNVHVLTLTATPIPRTLQLALTGVRELSLITTPPVDRLAVRTFVSPFDPVIIREALLRELYRGGQSFYVCPRISDLAEIQELLREHIPEVKFAVAHGQMAPGQLEDVMTAFYEGQYNLLLSTTIIESGLDIPTANTLIVHRADKFGLSQLYQLRGRVGRSKTRAYALFTVPANQAMTEGADKRLRVLQSLDSLGAGFTLASHDLDIRGAGNLLGEEQSGHIKEVGFELYQDMLEEAVASLRAGDDDPAEEKWSPQINIGTSVLIPERYVSDLELRLGLYRRLADLPDQDAVRGFGAELVDRFGSLPEEVEHLLEIVSIKLLCRRAGVSNVDAGPKGIVLKFHNAAFANPAGLIAYINEYGSLAKLRPDHTLVLKRDWPSPADRLKGAFVIMRELARVAEAQTAAA
jgi:transcription-repair coupling factor (superfamily II helicase)